MKKIISTVIFLLLTQASFAASIFDDLKESKKNYIMNNTFASVQVIDPVRGMKFFAPEKLLRILDNFLIKISRLRIV